MTLKEYIQRYGVQKKFLAEKIGISLKFFYRIVQHNLPVPKRYWKNVIEATEGRVTLDDLMNLEEEIVITDEHFKAQSEKQKQKLNQMRNSRKLSKIPSERSPGESDASWYSSYISSRYRR